MVLLILRHSSVNTSVCSSYRRIVTLEHKMFDTNTIGKCFKIKEMEGVASSSL